LREKKGQTFQEKKREGKMEMHVKKTVMPTTGEDLGCTRPVLSGEGGKVETKGGKNAID